MLADCSMLQKGPTARRVVFGLKRFRQYILERKVLVRSDHAALSYLRRTKDPVAQQTRWLDFIEQFDITERHRSGSAHRAADALSRRPCEGAGPCNQCNKRAGAVVAESPLQYENWGEAVAVEPRCAGVVTTGHAPRMHSVSLKVILHCRSVVKNQPPAGWRGSKPARRRWRGWKPSHCWTGRRGLDDK